MTSTGLGLDSNSLLSDNTVPCRAVQSIEFLLYKHCNILFDIILLEAIGGDLHCSCLHLLAHCGLKLEVWERSGVTVKERDNVSLMYYMP